MGIYKISGEEIKENFEKFLQDQEGDIEAETIADAWNIIASGNN